MTLTPTPFSIIWHTASKLRRLILAFVGLPHRAARVSPLLFRRLFFWGLLAQGLHLALQSLGG